MCKTYMPYLQHILDECQYVNSVITDDVTMSGFLADETLNRAVKSSLSIIGEATKKIPGDIKYLWSSISWKQMAGMEYGKFNQANARKVLNYAKEKAATYVMRYFEPDEAKLHRSGVAELGADDRLIAMQEKPAEPKSHWCLPAFYYYTKQDAQLVQKGIESGCGIDAPGSFIAWLCGQTSVYAWEMPGQRYDIGNLESYEAVKRTFGEI